jgi:hypothetical protein
VKGRHGTESVTALEDLRLGQILEALEGPRAHSRVGGFIQDKAENSQVAIFIPKRVHASYDGSPSWEKFLFVDTDRSIKLRCSEYNTLN